MLVIHRAQKQILARDLFHRWILEHVARFFPDRCAALGPAGVRAAVEDATRAARELGFDDRDDIGQFIDLTFMFGPGFPAAEHLWARRVLEDPSEPDPRRRMNRLYRAALRQLTPGGERPRS
ncbi:Hypothetical protein A7982_02136 [Minicystis rosea]|nr:Hypothetical protein A7982_02136 [Minicystis rosea]